jgi:RNA polymerase sigma-70 factor (ECF subfamily)
MPMSPVAEHRGLLMNVAYRILGSVAEAEDAVQETYARWYAMPAASRSNVESTAGWLITVTTRICLDTLRSARVRRERYVGEWLPEPIPDGVYWTSQSTPAYAADPADRFSLDESLSMALLVVLESMTPAERVSFILHDVFRYTFPEIGDIVGRTPQACRQLASQARRRISESRSSIAVPADEHARVVMAFHSALDSGDLAGLVKVLDPNVTAIGDGGGLVQAAIDPIVGAENVARHLLSLREQAPSMSSQVVVVNQRAGLVVRDEIGHPLAVASAAVADGKIERLWIVRNPTKLTSWL